MLKSAHLKQQKAPWEYIPPNRGKTETKKREKQKQRGVAMERESEERKQRISLPAGSSIHCGNITQGLLKMEKESKEEEKNRKERTQLNIHAELEV